MRLDPNEELEIHGDVHTAHVSIPNQVEGAVEVDRSNLVKSLASRPCRVCRLTIVQVATSPAKREYKVTILHRRTF